MAPLPSGETAINLRSRLFGLVLLLLWLATPLAAQPPATPAPTPSSSPSSALPRLLPPAITSPFGSGSTGEAVVLRGLSLFRLQSTRDISAQERADLLKRRLESLLQAEQDDLSVEVKRSKDGVYLSHRGVTLVTVNDADAEASETTPEALAIRWSQQLEQTLNRIRQEQGVAYLRRASLMSLLGALLCLLSDRILRWLTLRYLDTTGLSIRTLNALAWITYVFWQFPSTRGVANLIGYYGVRPLLTLLLVVSATVFSVYLSGRGITHYFRQLELSSERSPQTRPRWRQRLRMMRQVVSFVVNSLLIVLAIVIFFSLLDVNLGAVLAGAGFLGVALGLAAQNILKDWTAGVNIVLEDQFGAGDIIHTDGYEGVVENFTLRITQIRDMSGNLITLPNSSISIVKNLSNVWSQVDLSVPVSYRTDLRRALEVLSEVTRKLAEDWPDQVEGEAQVLGVEELGSYFVRLRLLQRTAPQQQFPVRRELLLRIKEAFEKEGLEIPLPSYDIRQR